MQKINAVGPDALLPGTEVGLWRVVSRRGRGSYGLVYRAEKVGDTDAGPFALKVAFTPLDPRFEREGEMLARFCHPRVPRLYARGWLMLSGDVPFPYLVMEWIEGMPLYDWASKHTLTSRQALRLLSQVARALEATHGAEGVHRDVKGDNVLVRDEDASAVLLDFGSVNFRGARPLTMQQPPPSTPQYQSPESLYFQWQHLRDRTARYEAGPADDVYALGVTAYRLVTGKYPPSTVDVEETDKGSQFIHLPLVPPETRVNVSPELAALIRQMLSANPSARGSAAGVAQALERAAETAGPEADQPITPLSAQAPAVQMTRPTSSRHAFTGLAAAMGMSLAVRTWWVKPPPPEERAAEVAQSARDDGDEDGETAGLADISIAAPVSVKQPGPARSGISLDMPKKPLPSQHRSPCEKPLVEINGGCWVGPTETAPPCGAHKYEWKNKCYLPMIDPTQPTTSDPP